MIEFANRTRPNIVCEQNPDSLTSTLVLRNKKTLQTILLKTKRIFVIKGLSPYRAVNTLDFGSKKRYVNVVQRNVAVCSTIHTD